MYDLRGGEVGPCRFAGGVSLRVLLEEVGGVLGLPEEAESDLYRIMSARSFPLMLGAYRLSNFSMSAWE